MRRLVVIEALDVGFVVRASGDAGKISKSLGDVDHVVAFLRWYMTRPADPEAGSITHPQLAIREAVDTESLTALEPRHLTPLPTESTVRCERSDAPPPITASESPVPASGGSTRILRPRWARPSLRQS